MITKRDWIAAILSVALVMGFLMTISSTMARAHDHVSEKGRMKYPQHCCHDMDCAPVTKVEIVPTNKVHAGMASLLPQTKLPSAMIVTTKHGSVMVPEGFKRDTSTDGQMHACIRNVIGEGNASKTTLICLFDPPAM